MTIDSVKILKKQLRLLKKPAAMIHIAGDLTMVERKLANVLLLNAYADLTTKDEHTISVPALYEFLGWDSESNNTDHLRRALNRLQTTLIKFDRLTQRGRSEWLDIQLVGRGKIEDGVCAYSYDRKLSERMANPETVFGTIDIDIQNRFASGFALALYENCVRFKRVGSTGFHSVDLWRELIGADEECYDEFKVLNQKALDPSVKQINNLSDIEIAQEYRRENRKIVAIRYSVREKNKENSPSAPDAVLQRFIDRGIAESVATDWIKKDPLRAQEALDHVDNLEKVRPMNNPAGYIRTLIESSSAITPKAKKPKSAEVAPVAPQERTAKDAIKALTAEQMEVYRLAYAIGAGVGHCDSYDMETGKFRKIAEKVRFMGWLVKNIGLADAV